MAYAALISLKTTINGLLDSHRLSIVPRSREIMEFAYEEVKSLQVFLERLDTRSSSSKSMDTMYEQIIEAVYELEDVIDSDILSNSETHPLLFCLDMKEVHRVLGLFEQAVNKAKDNYINELCHPLSTEEEEDVAISSSISYGGNESKMVGLSDQIIKLRDVLLSSSRGLKTISVLGMAGIGKTILARQVYDCELVLNHFDCRVWVKLGPKYQVHEILVRILAQINPDSDTDEMFIEGDERLWKYVYKCFSGRSRYLIVLDDIWDTKVLDFLKKLFPDNDKGNRVLVTTRLEEVTYGSSMYDVHRMRFMNKQESWDLLREKVFGDVKDSLYLCPPELEKAGKKIADNCEGLPLKIVTVAKKLSEENTQAFWNEVAEKENYSVFLAANAVMSEALFQSYDNLPPYVKVCFLYMGVFPRNHEIPCSKLIKLWSAEGFCEQGFFGYMEGFAMRCLKENVSNNLVVVREKSSHSSTAKTCSLLPAFWLLAVKEARKAKLFHGLDSRANSLAHGIERQRRFCIHKNVLFSIKDVYNSIASISNTRSLLFMGPPHPYPLPICFGLRLLRVLDALTVRFYEFPIQVVELVQLRYLALTYNGNLPSSISKLWNLQYLIVHRHLCIIESYRSLSYLPIEIWDMQELTHLHVMGCDLPDPCEGSLFAKLSTLVDVSSNSCTERILGRMPHLTKLGIRIELGPNAAGDHLSCFDHISCLNGLQSLKCTIVNPSHEVVPLPAPLLTLPLGLNRLSLSGVGYKWDDMKVIASLPNLQVLKLRCYAFRGPEWRTVEEEFSRLKFLALEDSDLEKWRVGFGSFRSLERLSIKHCYKLNEIVWESNDVQVIDVVDCSPSSVNWAEQMREKLASDEDTYVYSLFER